MSNYKVPAGPHKVEEVIKNSQFITRIRNVESSQQAKDFVKEMNQTYPDARHHCWAYIVGNPESTTLIGCSDDGEPSGTAGKPMLNVLQHAGIGDIAIVCTRYFGGVKLGTGGLARAYGGGVKLALEQLSLAEKIEYQEIQLTLEYSQLKDFEHILKDFQSEELQLKYQTTILASVKIASQEFSGFKKSIINQFKGQVEWNTTL